MNKEVKVLLKQAERQGFAVTRNDDGYPRITNPETGEWVVVALTPSDHRWRANTVARLRRIGFTYPPKR